jgi:hypothetical protein
MGALIDAGVQHVYHYTPLHYLPFIARDQHLRTKPSLKAAGFDDTHFRSKSHKHDTARGFYDFAFLTLDPNPRILNAKLAGGFPHIEIAIPTYCVESVDYSLSRFNIAMTRQLRRGNKPGFPESAANGRYYGDKQVPVAYADADKRELLQQNLGKRMIEVLLHSDLPFQGPIDVVCFHARDAEIASNVLERLDTPWSISNRRAPEYYLYHQKHREHVNDFIKTALEDPGWRGNGLDFDKV